MRKFVRYSLKGIAIFLGILLFVYILAYLYVVSKKKDIIAQIKEQVSDKLNGEAEIGNISLGFLAQFPSISVELEKVSIKDTLFNQHKHPFFEASKVYASISFLNLIRRNNPLNGLQVENGQLYIFTDSSGYTNSYLLSPKSIPNQPKKQSAPPTKIESVKFRKVRFVLDDQKKGKLYDLELNKVNCKIKDTDSSINIRASNNILIHSLAFNTRFGSYAREALLEGDIKVGFNKNRKQLNFENVELTLGGHPYKFSGTFGFAQTSGFALKVSTRDVVYAEAKALLSPKIQISLARVQVEGPIEEVNADISGTLRGGDPLVNINWKLRNNKVVSSFASFSECSFDGSFTNEIVVGLPRKDPNSRLQFHNFKGNFEGLLLHSQNISIDDMRYPMINADFKTDFELSQLNSLLATTTLDFHQGKGSLNLVYSGPLQHNSNKNTALNGNVTFTNGVVMYHPRNFEIKNVNGKILFKNTDVLVTEFGGDVQGSKIKMSGTGKNLLALMNTSPGKMFVDWNIYSPALNLNNFTALLKQRENKIRKSAGKSKLGSTAKNIDAIVNDANFRVNVKADELIFKRFRATNVKASVDLINENWFLHTVSLQHAGGSMAISGNLSAKNSKLYESNIKVNMQNVDVNKVMYAFNDFGQDGITYKNLRGKLSSLVEVKMDIDRDLKGSPGNMDGFINFSLKKGALLHYEPLEKIQEVAFQNRNFSEIYFAELKDRLDIKNKEIKLNRMEIQSTVLTLFVEGVYSLRGNTDISIQIPLSNLKNRGNYKLENKGTNAKVGASIFVRGRPGADGNVQFKLDLFRKLRKKDKEKGTSESTPAKS